MRTAAFATAIALSTTCVFQTTKVSAAPVTMVERHDAWAVYHDKQNGGALCFTASQPTDSTPRNVRRGPIYFYISSWVKDGVKSEISVDVGYPLRDKVPVTVKVGGDAFTLFTRGERAFVADPTAELKLVEAMRKGSTMTVEGTSTRGTRTSDTYSLIGVSAAIDKVVNGCK